MTTLRDVDDLFAALARGCALQDGEPVDLLEHALQCAHLLAHRHPDDAALAVAGLVHDVGSILEPGTPERHAETGAAAIEPLLGPRVAWLVGWHADAKRYLVTTDARYTEHLSERSRVTLDAQGGPLDATAVAALDAAPDRDALLALRRADDDAKVLGLDVPRLDAWRTRVEAIVI